MATSIILIKRFTYRDDPSEEWSNRYYLDGSDPADASAWNAIFTDLAAAEKTLYSSGTNIVRAYGYTSDAPSAASVWTKDLDVTGPLIPGTAAHGSSKMPGDSAFVVWWKTSRQTTTGKPIYLRKFFHDGRVEASDVDQLSSLLITAGQAFATLLASGAGVDGRHIRGVGQSSDVIFSSGINPYVTTRTLKRRGRRPTPAP